MLETLLKNRSEPTLTIFTLKMYNLFVICLRKDLKWHVINVADNNYSAAEMVNWVLGHVEDSDLEFMDAIEDREQFRPVWESI